MKVSDVLSIVSTVAGAFVPGVQSIEALIDALRHHESPRVQALAEVTANFAAMNPDDPVTIEEVQAALDLLNPPLEPEE